MVDAYPPHGLPSSAIDDRVSSPYIDNPYGYCGYYFDPETRGVNGPSNGGLYHVRHRVYDPVAGRWLQCDPAGFVDGMNLYEYCASGAVSCWDPMWLDPDKCDEGPKGDTRTREAVLRDIEREFRRICARPHH